MRCTLNSLTGCTCDNLRGAAKTAMHQRNLGIRDEMRRDSDAMNREAHACDHPSEPYNPSRDYTNE